jgi:hypothetical protein
MSVLDELLADDYRENPVGHETKWGEGWTRLRWAEHFVEGGFLDGLDPEAYLR